MYFREGLKKSVFMRRNFFWKIFPLCHKCYLFYLNKREAFKKKFDISQKYILLFVTGGGWGVRGVVKCQIFFEGFPALKREVFI